MTHELSIAFQTDKRAAEYVALALLCKEVKYLSLLVRDMFDVPVPSVEMKL